MHDHSRGGPGKSRDALRFEREAKRAAWRARFAARRAGQGDWSHLKDPKFWGLDPETMKQWGFNANAGHGANWGMGAQQNSEEVAQLKAQVAEMETTMGAMLERISVLERIVLDLDKDAREQRLAAEIEALRSREKGDRT